MWKAEHRLIELFFRSSRKRRADFDEDDEDFQYKPRRVYNRKNQATIPTLLPQSTEEERKQVDEEMERQRVTCVENNLTQPTYIVAIQPKQISDSVEIRFEKGPFYRRLDVISGIKAEDHIQHCKEVPIAPEDIGVDISLEILEKFGYFIIQVMLDKKVIPHFVHKSFLDEKKEIREIHSDIDEKNITNDTINIRKKTLKGVFSLEILYKSEESSSKDRNRAKLKRWIVFQKQHDAVNADIPMHEYMIEYFQIRPQISIPGMNYSTAGTSFEKSIML